MRTLSILGLIAAASLTARADFSYTSTSKTSGGMAPGAANNTSKTYMKGQKMKLDRGTTATILDFDAQTITHIDNNRKTYSVTKFSDMGQTLQQSGAEISVDFKETGQHKVINGYNATEAIMSMDMDNPQARQAGMKMHMQFDIWASPDVPGAQEVRAFYQRNLGKFPWSAMTAGGDPRMQQSMAEIQKKIASLKGVPVLQVMKMSMSGNEAANAERDKAMAQARQQLEKMKAEGRLSPQAEQALARMQGGSGSMMPEVTIESTDFSSSSIPDSVFAIPAGYQQTAK